MGLWPKACYNLFVYVVTGKDSSQWEIERERISKLDGCIRIKPETHTQAHKLDYRRWLCSFDLYMQ